MAALPTRPHRSQPSLTGPLRKWALLPLALWLVACGSEPAEPPAHVEAPKVEAETPKIEAPGSQPQAKRPPEQPAPLAADFNVEISGAPRFIPGHAPKLPEWGDVLRKRILAAGDASEQEKLAVNLERTCVELFMRLFAKAAPSAPSATTTSFTDLDCAFSEPRFEDATFRVYDSLLGQGVALNHQELREHWQAAGWSAVQVQASVIAVEATQDQQWLCEIELRIVGTLNEERAMLDFDIEVTVEDANVEHPSPHASTVRATSARLIRKIGDSFQAISGDVFLDLENWDRELALGSEDYLRVNDRRQLSAGTGILGMAIGDVNGDGLEDIYLSQRGGFPNRLLLHQPDGSVIDGAEAAGVDILDTTRGALIVDLDNDGDLDLCVSRTAEIILFWNDGNGVFSKPQVLDGPGNSPVYSICAADPDRDGDLDLYASRYPVGSGEEGVPTPYHNAENGARNLFWRNDGDRNFSLAGEELGLHSSSPRYSFVSLWDDFNDDGLIDLYVINDFGPNNLYINLDGKFEDQAAAYGLVDAAAGMGISRADVDMDGDLDVYVTNMYSAPGLRATAEASYRPGEDEVRRLQRRMAAGNSLLLNTGSKKHEEVGKRAGVDHGGWAWGAIFYDWNSDGLPDIYVPNGFITAKNATDVESLFWRWVVRVTPPPASAMPEYFQNWGALSFFNQIEGYSYNGHERNHLYLNIGNAEFADVSPLSDADFIDDGRVASRVDWDGDGFEDLLLVNRTGPRLRVIRNKQGQGAHRVALELIGKNGPAGAIGARVQVTRSDGNVVTRTLYAGEGLLGQSSTRLFFGLGINAGAVDVQIRWPDGTTQEISGLEADQGWKIEQAGGTESWSFTKSPFDDREATPVLPNPRGVERCVLAAPMPLRSLEFRGKNDRAQTMESLGPTIKLLVLWDPKSHSGEAFLRQISAVRRKIAQAKTLIVPISVDSDMDGKALLEELGLAADALRASPTDQLVVETLLMEALNTYDPIALPLSLLLDEDNKLCALYYGDIRSEELLTDLRRLGQREPGSDPTVALSGGFWLGQPKRRYKQISRSLMMLGARSLATDLKRARK